MHDKIKPQTTQRVLTSLVVVMCAMPSPVAKLKVQSLFINPNFIAPIVTCSSVFLRVKDFADIFANERMLGEIDGASNTKSFVRVAVKHLDVISLRCSVIQSAKHTDTILRLENEGKGTREGYDVS